MRPTTAFILIAAASCAFSFVTPVGSLAQDILPSLSETAPENENVELIRSADLAIRGQRLIEAEVLLNKLDAAHLSDSDRDDVTLLRGEYLIAVGHPAEARDILRMLNVKARGRCRTLIALATSDIQTKDFASAEMLLGFAVSRCSDDPVFWRTLGQASLALNLSSNAVSAYRQAIALDPGNFDLQNDLAVALIANGNAEEADKLLATVLLQLPDRADVAVNLDFAAAMLGRIPRRRSGDNDAFWSRRLQFAGAGARQSGRTGLAGALYAQAVIENPRYDEQLWQQYKGATRQQ